MLQLLFVTHHCLFPTRCQKGAKWLWSILCIITMAKTNNKCDPTVAFLGQSQVWGACTCNSYQMLSVKAGNCLYFLGWCFQSCIQSGSGKVVPREQFILMVQTLEWPRYTCWEQEQELEKEQEHAGAGAGMLGWWATVRTDHCNFKEWWI